MPAHACCACFLVPAPFTSIKVSKYRRIQSYRLIPKLVEKMIALRPMTHVCVHLNFMRNFSTAHLRLTYRHILAMILQQNAQNRVSMFYNVSAANLKKITFHPVLGPQQMSQEISSDPFFLI